MPQGGKLTVTAKAITPGNGTPMTVEIAVADTGIGIEEKDLSKIFQPFFSMKKKGLGLGLPISERIVRNHGGKIEVQSRPGQGTTFSLYLPLEQKFSDAKPAEALEGLKSPSTLAELGDDNVHTVIERGAAG
jgi:two-component system NtrC family sensor kinase